MKLLIMFTLGLFAESVFANNSSVTLPPQEKESSAEVVVQPPNEENKIMPIGGPTKITISADLSAPHCTNSIGPGMPNNICTSFGFAGGNRVINLGFPSCYSSTTRPGGAFCQQKGHWLDIVEVLGERFISVVKVELSYNENDKENSTRYYLTAEIIGDSGVIAKMSISVSDLKNMSSVTLQARQIKTSLGTIDPQLSIGPEFNVGKIKDPATRSSESWVNEKGFVQFN